MSQDLRNTIASLWVQYTEEMMTGRQLQERAWLMMNEAEGASDGYVEMRAEFRQRAGNDGHGNATNDYKYSQFKDAQTAGKDNAWYMTRSQMFAAMASMHFNKAAAIMANIARTEAQLPKPLPELKVRV